MSSTTDEKISTTSIITENFQNTRNKEWTLKDSRERKKIKNKKQILL